MARFPHHRLATQENLPRLGERPLTPDRGTGIEILAWASVLPPEALDLAEGDLLRAFPEGELAELR